MNSRIATDVVPTFVISEKVWVLVAENLSNKAILESIPVLVLIFRNLGKVLFMESIVIKAVTQVSN